MDAHLKELVAKGMLGFGLRIFGAAMAFALQVVLARKLGISEFGLYSLCIALTMLLASVARLGLDIGVVRKVAGAMATGKLDEASAWFARSMQSVLVAGMVVSILVFIGSGIIASDIYENTLLTAPLRVFAFVIPATALMFLMAESLKGLKEVVVSSVVQSVAVPSMLLAILLVLPAGLSALNVGFIYLALTLFSILYGYSKWRGMIGHPTRCALPMSEVLRFGWPFFLANIGSMLLTWSDTIIVGLYENSDVVAGYFAANRLASLASFILISINAISAPKFTAMHTLGDHAGLARLARQSTAIMIGLALVPTALLLFFPSFWLGLFGDKFEQAQFSLIALTAGQAVNVACGSVGFLLAMTGHERLMGRISLASASLAIIFGFTLGNIWGVKGVAVASAAGIAVWNIWMLLAVKRKLGFWAIPIFPHRA